MNWRESIVTSIRQGAYAKGAKGPSEPSDTDLLHLLHTYFEESHEETREKQEATNQTVHRPREPESLESILKGLAIELWSNAAGRLFIVADEDDAQRLGEPRGEVYTANELRCVVQIGDPATVQEIHEWKRTFDAHVREVKVRESGPG